MQENKWWGSSVDPQAISLTLKGIGVAIIPVLVFLGGAFGLSFAEADLTQLVSAVATAFSSVMVVVGLCRKIYVKMKK